MAKIDNSVFDVVVIGGGPAGLASALRAWETGSRRVLLIERDHRLGGILQQCIHPGFGLEYFKEELTGPEYYSRFLKKLDKTGVEILLETTVLDIEGKKLKLISPGQGIFTVTSLSIVLAMGCRERTRAAVGIPGSRPAGIFTAGAAQRLINIQGYKVGKKAVILGSGDIGMIMARRLTWEGVEVAAIAEALPYLTGLVRNKVQCIDDFNIPLHMEHTVTDIRGSKRVEEVTIAELDPNSRPVQGTERRISCDTLLLSVGLIPENEISRTAGVLIHPVTRGPVVNQCRQTSVKHIFACGNTAHVNDLVDFVSIESEYAGQCASLYAAGYLPESKDTVELQAGENVSYVVPQTLSCPAETEQDIDIYFRAQEPVREAEVRITSNQGRVISCFNRIRCAPGEMEKVVLDRKLTRELSGNISINVVGKA